MKESGLAKAKRKEAKYLKFFSHDVITCMLCGYLTGVLLTVVWHLNFSTGSCNVKKWAFFVIMEIVILLLSYSRSVRCTIILIIPILCSSKGRSLVVALAFTLAATGPTFNILRNVAVLTQSMSCGETQLKQALDKMLETLKQPLVTIKEAVMTVMRDLKDVLRKVEAVLFKIKELVVIVLAGMKNAFDWLSSVVGICNKEFGTPFERCIKQANDAMEKCKLKMGALAALCSATHIFSWLCYAAKIVDVICVMMVFFNDSVVEFIMGRVKAFTEEVKNMFQVSISFDHDFTFQTTASKNMTDVGADIIEEIQTRMSKFFWIFSGLEIISSLLLMSVVLKAIYFRMKYVRSPGYQNCYITREFYEIDERRIETNQERALPLTKLERRKYVPLAGCRLTPKEIFKLARSMVFLVVTCLQLSCICLADYGLYWVLALITYYGSLEGDIEVPPFITVEVKGSGTFVAQIFQGIVRAFEPLAKKYNIDATPCLPVPKVPNLKRYLEIAFLCLLAWICLLCQPYGLRLRHLVMRIYYPEVSRERAAWLYNKILIKRAGFFKMMRRKARAKFLNDKTVDNVSCIDWMRGKTEGIWLCRVFMGKRKASSCIICATPVHGDDRISCGTWGCKAIYCRSCFEESNQTCCICKKPVEYGDTSDISEEQDSSDAPEAVVCKSEQSKQW